VRARMVEKPADYRFCSFGEWSATGKHPFAEAVEKRKRPVNPSSARNPPL